MERGNEKAIELLYRLFGVSVSASAVILLFSDFFAASGVAWKHFGLLFLTGGVFLAVKSLHKRRQLYALLAIVLFFVLLAAVAGREKFTGWILAGRSFWWVLVLTVSACMLQLLFEKYVVLKIGFTVLMCILLLYFLFAGRYVPQAGVGLVLLYAAATTTECIRSAAKKGKRENARAYLVWVTPFLILYFCILCLTPAPGKPYSWQWLVDLYLRAEEKITIYAENFTNRDREDMDGTISGFSEKSELFSEVAANHKNIMVIGTSQGKKQPLYLAAKIYDSFDGREWKSTNEERIRERLFDTLETMNALERYKQSDPKYLNCYNSVLVKTEYRHFQTDYLLAPSKTWKIETESDYRQRGADLVFDKKAKYGTTYMFRYCRINMERDAMRDFLQIDPTDNGDLWENTAKRYAEEGITGEKLQTYRENIRKRYLKETVLTPQTQEWVDAVTREAENDIDRLFCIEEALADMQYSTNPGGLPKEVADEGQFLHYFLTENPAGYCSYFATAFVLLARAEGFPARYVQGFCVPLGNAEETEVYAGMAHAWPEVYLEGRGWIPFEPTPGYAVRRYAAEAEKAAQKDSAVQTREQETKEYGADDVRFSDEREAQERKQKRIKTLKKGIAYLLTGAAFLLMTGVLVLLLDRLYEKYRDRQRSTGEKYKLAVLRNLQILSMLGYEREPSETYQELARRIADGKGKTDIPTGFMETYESILYGTREAGAAELEECLELRETLMRILREEKGRKYWICRIRLSVLYYHSC